MHICLIALIMVALYSMPSNACSRHAEANRLTLGSALARGLSLTPDGSAEPAAAGMPVHVQHRSISATHVRL